MHCDLRLMRNFVQDITEQSDKLQSYNGNGHYAMLFTMLLGIIDR